MVPSRIHPHLAKHNTQCTDTKKAMTVTATDTNMRSYEHSKGCPRPVNTFQQFLSAAQKRNLPFRASAHLPPAVCHLPAMSGRKMKKLS